MAIANWNGAAHLSHCLDALFSQTHPPAEVILVDNGSTDGSRALVQSQYPQVRLIERPINEGVSRGYNLAIANSKNPYLLILNTDVFLDRDFLFEALKAIRSSSSIGWVAAKIHSADTNQVENVGFYLRPWISVVNSKNVSKPEFVFAASGSALFCRREMLEDISLSGEYFDEAFFAYREELDLAWRAQLRGWRCLYCPTALAQHIGSASHGGEVRVIDKPAFLQRHAWKNRYLLVVKNASYWSLIVLAPSLLMLELLSWPYLLFAKPRSLPVFLQAHREFLRLVPETLEKRRFVQRGRRVKGWRILKFLR